MYQFETTKSRSLVSLLLPSPKDLLNKPKKSTTPVWDKGKKKKVTRKKKQQLQQQQQQQRKQQKQANSALVSEQHEQQQQQEQEQLQMDENQLDSDLEEVHAVRSNQG